LDQQSLRNLRLRKSYTRGIKDQDPIENFLKPCLKNSIEYNIITGYFSSRLFSSLFYSLKKFLENGGKIQLITGWLYDEDIKVLLKDREELKKYFFKKFSRLILEFEEMKEFGHLSLLAWLIFNKRLEIKFGIPLDDYGRPLILKNYILHEKVGYFKDKSGNIISFSGSANVTFPAWFFNREEFKVFNNWTEVIKEYCDIDIEKFQTYWKNTDPHLKVVDISQLPKKILNKLMKYKKSTLENIDFEKIDIEIGKKLSSKEVLPINVQNGWKIYEEGYVPIIAIKDLRKCQINALDYLEKKHFCGILSMATGSGKTRVALRAIYELYEKIKHLCVIISVPDKYLITQWRNKLLEIVSDEIIIEIHSEAPQGKKDSLIFFRNLKLKNINLVIILGTNRSLDKKFYDSIYREGLTDEEILFIGDECHTLGTPLASYNLSEFNPKYKIGLSATPERQYDEYGSNFIYEFFKDEEFFKYTLKEGQADKYLMEYKYHFEIATISDADFEEYKKYSQKVAQLSGQEEDKAKKINDFLIKRAKILKKNQNKLKECEKILEILIKNEKIKKTVIYCFDNNQMQSLIEEHLESLMKQYENSFYYAKFDGTMTQDQKEEIKNKFEKRNDLILLAMKCLDQGVDIPSLERAIFLSSSGSTREHIQRSGRLLRKNEDTSKGEFVEIYDIITLPLNKQYNEHEGVCESIIKFETDRAKFFIKNSINQEDNIKKLENKLSEIRNIDINKILI